MISSEIDIAHVMRISAVLTGSLLLKQTHGVAIHKDGLVMRVQNMPVLVRDGLVAIDTVWGVEVLKILNVDIVSHKTAYVQKEFIYRTAGISQFLQTISGPNLDTCGLTMVNTRCNFFASLAIKRLLLRLRRRRRRHQ